jgi:hypothetical protein
MDEKPRDDIVRQAPASHIGDALFARWVALLILVAIFLSLAAVAPAAAQYCPQGQAPTSDPPTQNVVVSILSVKPNSDMEGADDYIPFYDNRADIYGTVTIDGEDFALPKINDSNFPHWGEQNGRFVRHVEGGIIPIRVQVGESDSASSDDSVDVTPAANRDTLELAFDTCALRITGDVAGSAQNVIEAKAGNDSDDAIIRLRVEMEDGRAITSNDVALVNFDLFQVVPQVSRIVADKPIVGIVRVANNTPVTLPVSVRLQVTGQNNVPVLDVTESLGEPLQPGEVRKKYLLESTPLRMQDIGRPYTMHAEARILHNYDETSPDPNDPSPRCRIINNSSGSLAWTVVPMQRPDILWIRVSALLDATDFVSMERMEALRDLAVPFINGVYPVPSTSVDTSSFPLVLPVAAAQDFLYSILQITGLPSDSLVPFAMVLDLNGIAALTGHDRVMGVVRHEWFQRFSHTFWDPWGNKSGVSLGEFAPRGVLFQASKTDGNTSGPQMTLPAHELGHTYGLSVDPTIKNTWACQISGPLGVLSCGIAGGFDEYNADTAYDGLPTGGYWVRQGPVPQVLDYALGEQCTFCLMGNSPANAHLNWTVFNRWIDPADYDHLLDKLSTSAVQPLIAQPQQYVFLSGILAHNDRAYLGASYRLSSRPRVVDFTRNDKDDVYAVRFIGENRHQLSQVTLPIDWNQPDFQGKIPVTFFAGTAVMPQTARAIEVWNRKTGRRIASRMISANTPVLEAPTVKVEAPLKAQSGFLTVSWSALDPDGDKLSHYVHLRRPGQGNWWPLGHEMTSPSLRIPLTDIPAGVYELRVLSSDGINVGERTTRVRLPATP